MFGLNDLDAAGDRDLLNRIESFLESHRMGDAEATRFASNLADDGHWEDLDTLKLYLEQLLKGANAGLSRGENCWSAHLAVVDKCQEDGANLPHPGDVDSDPPKRLSHVFWDGALKGQLQEHDVEKWKILTTTLLDDPGLRALLARDEDKCVRTGEPSCPPHAMAWATFDEAGGEHPFDNPAYKDGAGSPAADKVASALGMEYEADKKYVLARYPSAHIGEVRVPTVCDGRDWKNFKACGRTDPGDLPERLHRPLRVRDLDRHLICLAQA